jgi:hypothetical protein
MSAGVALRQRVQQCLRVLQVSRVKALGEPVRGSRLHVPDVCSLTIQQTGRDNAAFCSYVTSMVM